METQQFTFFLQHMLLEFNRELTKIPHHKDLIFILLVASFS